MAGAKWIKGVFAALACAGFAWGQQFASPFPQVASGEQMIILQEPGGPQQQCKVLKSWVQPDGVTAYEVQAQASGEKMTIVEMAAPAGRTAPRTSGRMTRIFHWHGGNPPPGAPMPPAEASVQVMPASVTVDAGFSHVTPVPSSAFKASQPMTAAPGMMNAETYPTTCNDGCHSGTVVATQAASAYVPSGGPVTVVENDSEQGPDSAGGFRARMSRVFHWHRSGTSVPADESVPMSTVMPAGEPPHTAAFQMASPYPSTPVVSTGSVCGSTCCDGTSPMPGPATMTAVPATSGPATAVRVSAGPASPSDWRQSWGKADDHKTKVPPVDLPHAANSEVDPLKNPASYMQLPTQNKKADGLDTKLVQLNDKPAQPQSVEVATLAGAPGAQSVLAAGHGPFGPLGYIPVPMTSVPPVVAPAPLAAPPAAPQPQQQPFVVNAFGSTAPAAQPPQAPQVPGPAMVPNAFTPAKSGQTMSSAPGITNSFTAAAPAQPFAGVSNSFMAAAPAQPVSRVMYLASTAAAQGAAGDPGQRTSGTLPGALPAGYAAVAPGAPVEIPAQAQPAAEGGTITPVSATSMGYGLKEPSPAGRPTVGDGANSQDMLLAMLRDALFPSHREWAAETLASGPDVSPQVVLALVQSARQDPAATVRATCVRCLAKLKADTPEVRQALAALQTDSSSIVKQEADTAVGKFGGQPTGERR